MSVPVHEMVDRSVGDYRVTGVLGSGGMAVVYRAVDAGGHEVALKMLRDRSEGGDQAEASRARFEREVEQASRLDHPNLVRVHGAGELDGVPYYVMDLVEGSTLQQYLRSVELPPFDDAVHILKGICKGLAHLHEKKLVHRDLKPANIFLLGERLDVVLGDFGLLKPLEVDDLTAANERIGTPAYMSPEQFKGTKIDTRSDIYQLGVLLFRLLTGQVPFQDENFFRLGTKHMTRRPPAPTSLNPEIPDPLEGIILRCLEKRPKARYQDAGEVVRELNRYLIRKEMGTAERDAVPGGPLSLTSSAVARPHSEDDGLASRIRNLLASASPPGESPEERARREAAADMSLGLVSMVLAGLCLWVAVRPALPILGASPLAVALACQVVLVLRGLAWVLRADWAPGLLRGAVLLAALNWVAFFLPVVTGATVEQVVLGEATLLQGDPWAWGIPLRAPFTFGRSALVPGLALLFLLRSMTSMNQGKGGRSLRELCDFAFAGALVLALSRCSLQVAAGVFGWR